MQDKYDEILKMKERLHNLRKISKYDGVDIVVIDGFLSKLGDDFDVLSEAMNQLTESEKKQLKGRKGFERINLILKLKSGSTQSMVAESKVSKLLSDVVDEYMSDYVEERKISENEAPTQTKNEYAGKYKEFIRIVGDISCNEMNKDVVKNYRNLTRKLPSGLNQSRYTGKSIAQILSMKNSSKKSSGTISKEFMLVKKLLKWGAREGYFTKGLEEFFPVVRDNTRSSDKRNAFCDEALKQLFNSKWYQQGLFKQASKFWIPLLALFTGCRGNEIAQLYKDDIQQHSGTKIWFISIRESKKRHQRLKNKNSERIIPVHRQLIKLGFIKFVSELTNGERLFSELSVKDGKCFKYFGNWFNRCDYNKITRKHNRGYILQCGVVKGNTSFHSFRHNVIDSLEKSIKVHERVKNQLVGHAYSGSSVSNYIKADDIKTLRNAINTLSYSSIDFRKIRKWK